MDYQIYDCDGWIDVPKILSEFKCVFHYWIGGRGTGKTYGCLKFLVQHHLKFMLLRRTQKIVDNLIQSKSNPFKSLNHDLGWSIEPLKVNKDLAVFAQTTVDDKGKLLQTGEDLGYMTALTTISDLRGSDWYDVDVIFYDEFIPEEHKNRIKGEAQALWQAYETINRNRELQNKPPVILICAANSNNIYNPIFVDLQIVNKVFEMKCKHQEVWIDRGRSSCVINMEYSPISEAKKDTALYRMMRHTKFFNMSVNNEFELQTFSRLGSRNLKEYKPIVKIGELVFYEHKSRDEIYVCTHKSGNIPEFATTNVERIRFRRSYSWIWMLYLSNQCIFETINLEYLIAEYFINSA